MTTSIDVLAEIVTTLTTIDTARIQLDGPATSIEHHVALSNLTNLMRQLPARHADRLHLLDLLNSVAPEASTTALLAVAEILRRSPPRVPMVAGTHPLPALDPVLTETFAVLQRLDRSPQPWTVVGGLMVMVHCGRHNVPFTRATGDADIAVGVFTHRRALRELTRDMTKLGFVDVTPEPLAGALLSYRWARDPVMIDLIVPERVNNQDTVPLTASRLPAVELPGVQQALARTERLTIALDDGRTGPIRVPDLLGALTIKSTAVLSDRRATARHLSDLVALLDALAASGDVIGYAGEIRSEDRTRIRRGTDRLTASHWLRSEDSTAAQDALGFLLGNWLSAGDSRRTWWTA